MCTYVCAYMPQYVCRLKAGHQAWLQAPSPVKTCHCPDLETKSLTETYSYAGCLVNLLTLPLQKYAGKWINLECMTLHNVTQLRKTRIKCSPSYMDTSLKCIYGNRFKVERKPREDVFM